MSRDATRLIRTALVAHGHKLEPRFACPVCQVGVVVVPRTPGQTAAEVSCSNDCRPADVVEAVGLSESLLLPPGDRPAYHRARMRLM